MLKSPFDVCAHTVNKKYDNHIFIVAFFLSSSLCQIAYFTLMQIIFFNVWKSKSKTVSIIRKFSSWLGARRPLASGEYKYFIKTFGAYPSLGSFTFACLSISG